MRPSRIPGTSLGTGMRIRNVYHNCDEAPNMTATGEFSHVLRQFVLTGEMPSPPARPVSAAQ